MSLLLNRRLAFAALLATSGIALPATAQTAYPDKPIRLIVPYAPGGSTGALATTLASLLGKALGQQVFVDHRAGGSTVIGTDAAAKAAPDGYTLLFSANSHVVVPALTATPYDPFKQFIPIGSVAKTEFVLVVHPSVPAQDIREFMSLAKAKPGEVSYGSAGNGSGVHLASEQFAQAAGVKMLHVPYKGSGPMVTDLLGGQFNAAFQTPAVALPHIANRRLRALAVTGNDRLPALPGVPTLAESGIANLELANWFGLLAPAGTPKDIVTKVGAALDGATAQPEWLERLNTLGLQPFRHNGEAFERVMRAEFARMTRLQQTLKIQLD